MNREQVGIILSRIEALAKNPINASLENGYRDFMDPDAPDKEIRERLVESLEEIISFAEHCLQEVKQ